MPTTTYIGLGSNIEPREEFLRKAVSAVHGMEVIDVIRISSVYETEPWGKENQQAFLNCVIECQATIDPQELLRTLKSIETSLGRRESERYGAREIDLDILFYGNEVLNTGDLVIPHERLHVRRFVLVPLAELAPELRHPVIGGTVNDLLAICKDMGRIWKHSYTLDIPQ